MCHSVCPCIKGPVTFERKYCCCGYSHGLTWCGWCLRIHDAQHQNKRWLPLTGIFVCCFLYCHWISGDFGQLLNWLCTCGYGGRRCQPGCRTDPQPITLPGGCPTFDEWLDISSGTGSAVDLEWKLATIPPNAAPGTGSP